jgi:hypothetical protein
VLFEPLQSLLKVMQHLVAKHGQFLHGKEEFFAIHLQQFTVTNGHGSAEAAVLWIHQGHQQQPTGEPASQLGLDCR